MESADCRQLQCEGCECRAALVEGYGLALRELSRPIMMKRWPGSFALLLVLSCSSDLTGPVGTRGEFQYSFADPVGDTLPPPPNVFQRALDVQELHVGLTADSIIVRVDFTGPISAWSSNALNSIDGFVDFDFDDNPSTGYPAATEEFGEVDAQMGAESYISLRDDGRGQLLRRDGDAPDWRFVRVEFGSRSFTLRFGRSEVGETDGVFRVSAMIGGTGRWITDLVPGAGHYRIGAP